jgi:DNA-binding transcriptional MerR regulator
MFGIGDFARHGRVSVRMLRHYDATGLLRPAHVDPSTGYRSYEAAQLSRLNRIIALKELGFTLQQVQAVLDEQVSAGELRGMLRLRRAELQASIMADTSRLGQVEVRLRTIEHEGAMPEDDVVVKRIPAVRVVEMTAVAASYAPEHIGPASGPLYARLLDAMERAGVVMTGSPISYYEDAPGDEGAIIVHAAFPVGVVPGGDHGLAVVDLPEIAQAATVLHRGAMDDVVPTGQTLARWVDGNGYRAVGYARELYIECPPGDFANWVTELQIEILAD